MSSDASPHVVCSAHDGSSQLCAEVDVTDSGTFPAAVMNPPGKIVPEYSDLSVREIIGLGNHDIEVIRDGDKLPSNSR